MNREILFRGKRANTKEWIYGDVQQNVDAVKIREQEQSIQRIAKSFVVIPETVGQFTGLTDIHGVKIYEGDIIEAHFDELFPDLATTLVVVWSDYGWFGRDMEGNVDSLERKWVSDFFEIIGNIHDNPEMLEVSKE